VTDSAVSQGSKGLMRLLSSESLNDNRDAHTASYAATRDSMLLPTSLEGMEERNDNAHARGADRMPKCDGSP